MRIGLSILTHQGQSLWNNGIGQNVLHLATLLRSLPFVEKVILLDCGDQKVLPGDVPADARVFELLTLPEAEGAVDVAVEIAGGIDPRWIARHRARGGRMIWHICGQPYSGLIEPSVFEKPGYWTDPHRADEIWLLPKDAKFTPLLRGIHRCPVEVVPYIWAAGPLETSIAADPDTMPAFGYRSGSLKTEGAALAVFEPNISPIKTCLPSMLLADVAERLRPGAVASLALYNTQQLNGQATFDFALRNLDLHKAGKVQTLAREYFSRAMRKANVVVTHQLECTQNYLYLDALYGGYPLIHNSPLFSDIGYYYPATDLEAGARQVLHAIDTHDASLDAYRANAAQRLARLHPSHADNRNAYARRLLSLFSQDKGRLR